ncbi:lantibiotic dehydratase [Streptomyces sp. SPB162]|uniref:lantibiotic dehydratase n=1 Tax=Streptomyces sp. SPB162 TaxID=2940560 RepID=UPI0024057830|nr:lantibiotic dehydratase [Streptomyces sp. SPB162]MDF9813014.1 thiopeptide-type bacteriocin biosynthesis protein [Streptomyces sp. SPB162]
MYHALDAGVIRASVVPMAVALPAWPGESADPAQLGDWMGEVWADASRAEAISHAAPVLTQAVCKALDGSAPQARIESTARSLARYLLRMQHRATPFGLFAGAAPVRLGQRAHVRWGGEHRAFAGADAGWLREIITALERDPEVLRNLAVIADSTWTAQGPRIVVPYQPGTNGPTSTSLRRTRAAEQMLALARTPIRVRDLVDKIRADYPDTPVSTIETMITNLVDHRVLLTELSSPMTTVDALGHLVHQLEGAGADRPATAQLRQVHRRLQRHDLAHIDEQAGLRAEALELMSALTSVTVRPLVVNIRPDAEIVLPEEVAREAEHALRAMAGITPYPKGSPAWNDYRTRFLERYSMGTVVSLRDLTDPDTGLGVPVGYRGTVLPRPLLGTTPRDERLLALAQDAALTNRREVTLTEDDVKALSLGEATQFPAHVELCFTVLATSQSDLDEGRFKLSTVGLSLAAGTTTGRFLSMLPTAELNRQSAAYMALPTLTAGAVRAQVTAPPMKQQTFNVGRAPVVAPEVLAVGEYNPAATLDLDDLGVMADADRLYLVTLSSGRVIEPSVMNAVELSHATHPLVRFLCEVHRSHSAILIPFAWGTAARLPFLPEVRYGRTILSAACWRLRTENLGDGEEWIIRFTNWRIQYGVPRTVYVGSNDQLLRLDLGLSAHRDLLRHELNRHRSVVLHEAPDESAFGWIGHAHEVVLPFVSDQRPAPAPAIRLDRAVKHRAGRLPGSSDHAFLKLYGNPSRVPELLTTHLPRLLTGWDTDPAAWFVRYADPEPHVRLRLRLTSPEGFGPAAQKVAAWASELREEGVIQRITWDTDQPETGRYGTGAVLDAAEAYFAADSAAALAQMLLDPADLQSATAAASFVDICAGLLGSHPTGLDWLTRNLQRADGEAAPRHVQALAVRLSGTDAVQTVLGEPAVARTWEARRLALLHYRAALEDSGSDPADVLPSLLHMHHNRVAGIDPAAEATCRRTARAAALSWIARSEGALR